MGRAVRWSVLCSGLVVLISSGTLAQPRSPHDHVPSPGIPPAAANPALPSDPVEPRLAQVPQPTGAPTAPAGRAPPQGCESHSPLPPAAERPEAKNPDPSSRLPNDLVAYQQFPPSGKMQTAWFVTFNHSAGRGLFISRAYFKPGPDRPWMKILDRAEVSEIFVPYQSGSPRYLDFAAYNFPLLPAADDDRGRCGVFVDRTLGGNVQKAPFVVREVVDKGVLWKRGRNVYRGHKMALWGTVDAANYNYIISYAFHDDGYIEFRGGATSQNLPESPSQPHLHNFFWRIDVDINGRNNKVSIVRHLENVNEESWQDCEMPFNRNREGPLALNPREFTMLHVTGENMAQQHAGYMIMPLYRGQQRHKEPWTRADIWVTRYREEDQVRRIQDMQSMSRGESIDNVDLVIWAATPLLHLPRAEDGRCLEMGRTDRGVPICKRWHGSATVMWAGVDLKPHNLFDSTPMYPGVVKGSAASRTAYHPPQCGSDAAPAPKRKK